MIASLLLEPCDLAALAGTSQGLASRPSRALDLLVARVGQNAPLAARLARRLSRRAAGVAHLLDRSPYQILLLWSAQRDALSHQEIGVMLARLACTGDATLTPLAQRLRRDVELEALRRLPDELLARPPGTPYSAPP